MIFLPLSIRIALEQTGLGLVWGRFCGLNTLGSASLQGRDQGEQCFFRVHYLDHMHAWSAVHYLDHTRPRTNLQLGKWSDWFESGLDQHDIPTIRPKS